MKNLKKRQKRNITDSINNNNNSNDNTSRSDNSNVIR